MPHFDAVQAMMVAKQLRTSQEAVGATPKAFPVQALLDRLGAAPEAQPWACYLPRRLRPAGVPAPLPGVHGGHLHPKDYTPDSQDSLRISPSMASCEPVTGRVWRLSQDATGCREVQHALEASTGQDEREAIAGELRGRIAEAARCPHANHVVQKLVVTMRPQSLQFIIDELMAGGGSVQAARHKFGCRILQRLLEHCPPAQVSDLVEAVLAEAVPISRHPYGNYVMQHLLEFGTGEQKHRLAQVLEREMRGLGSDTYGCAVVSSALCHSSHGDQLALARTLLKEPGLLVYMACTRHGHLAVTHALQVLEGQERLEARQHLAAESTALCSSRYGRVVVACLDSSVDC